MMVVVALDERPLRANSVTSVMAVGRQPPSPRPAQNRKMPNNSSDGAIEQATVNNENTAAAKIITFRRPRKSVTVPMVIAPMVIPIRPVVAAAVAPAGVMSQTLSRKRTGMTVPSTTRSKPSSRTADQHRGVTQEVVLLVLV